MIFFIDNANIEEEWPLHRFSDGTAFRGRARRLEIRLVLKNADHFTYEQWDSLLSKVKTGTPVELVPADLSVERVPVAEMARLRTIEAQYNKVKGMFK